MKKKQASKAEKFQWMQAHPQPCSQEELREHLAALVDNLIDSRLRERWRLNLLTKPKRAKEEIRGWIPFDQRYCRELCGTQGWPQHIETYTGVQLGVYFDPNHDPVKLRASEASSKATGDAADAILSILPGRVVVFFNHESQVWLCKR